MNSLIWNKKAKKNGLISLLVTLAVILALVIAGPVNAVNIKIQTDKPVYSKEDGVIKFTLSVDIDRNEIVPIKYLTLKISNGKECRFNPDGSHSCPNIIITKINSGTEATGNMTAEGWGFENPDDKIEKKETEFGYGYGIGSEPGKDGFKGELLYEIEWNFVADGAQPGRYEANLEAYAEGAKEFTYVSRSTQKFNIKPLIPLPAVMDSAEVLGRLGEIRSLNGFYGFKNQDLTFGASLKSTKDGKIRGRTSLDLYAEKADSTKLYLNIEIRNPDYSMISFTKDLIEYDGKATFEYSKTKQGIWSNGKRTGYEAPAKADGEITVHVKIENGKVTISSADPKLPFDVETLVTHFIYD